MSTSPSAAPVPYDLSRHRPALVAFFRKRVPSSQVDDLVQDVFVNVYARQSQTPIENIDGYLFAVALSALARRSRRTRRGREVPFETEEGELEALIEPISPERVLLDKEGLARAVRIIEQLPPRTQQIFVLHRFEEMTYPAIARAMGVSVSTVEKHIMTALATLASRMGVKR
jgi:RNA polymerase sigma factor (sigma-70 family)